MTSIGMSVYPPAGCFVTINKLKDLINTLTRLMVNCGEKNVSASLLCFQQVLSCKLMLGEWAKLCFGITCFLGTVVNEKPTVY